MRISNKISSFVAIALVATNIFAQKVQFDKNEFDHLFRKNCRINNIYTPREDYLTLYVNYKLKVQEAKSLQLDTLSSYKKECKMYRDELTAPYMVDSAALDAYKQTISTRFKTRIHASHVLVPVANNASPADSLAAYNKISLLRDSLMKCGSSLGAQWVLPQSGRSDVIEEDLVFFTTLNMVTPFEDAAYATPVGTVSPIVRSQFGYHFINVKETKPFRQIQVAHIMRAMPDTIKSPSRADMHLMDSLLSCIRRGEDFEALAKKYSTDMQSAHYGGKMPWLFEDTNIPGFMNAALSLKRDEVSGIVVSPFGLHIIKMLDERSSIPDAQLSRMFAELMDKSKVSALSAHAIASKTAKKYKAVLNHTALNDIVGIALSSLSNAEKLQQLSDYKSPIITLASGYKIYVRDVDVPVSIPSNQTPSEYKSTLIDVALSDYYKKQLPVEDANYRYTLAEYIDGPLVYEMNVQHVWGRQDNDSTIIDYLYKANPSRYSKGGSFSGRIYICDSSRDADKVRKAVDKGKPVDKKLYVELIEGDQNQGGLYDDYLWPYLKSDCIVIDGTFTDGQQLEKQLAAQQLQVDLITYREREYAKMLRKKYNVENNPRF